jgi:hypothetical protein
MTELRTRMMLVRFTSAEFDRVRAAAQAAGRPLARYVRETTLGAVPRARRHHAIDEVLRHLARIGNNVNQLAHVANATDRFPTEAKLDAVLAELRATVHRITESEAQ